MKIINWIKKRVSMGRPRIIKLQQGEISLYGFSKEVADALSTHIKSYGQSSVDLTEVTHTPIVETAEDNTMVIQGSAMYNGTAYGVTHNTTTNKYEVAVIKYCTITNSAYVESIELEDYRRDAVTKFKMKAANSDYV